MLNLLKWTNAENEIWTFIDDTGSYLIATHSEISPTEDIETHIWELTTGSHLLKVKATSGGVSKMEFVSNNKYV